jgi:quercetin dioxygenase-like cupin family protein
MVRKVHVAALGAFALVASSTATASTIGPYADNLRAACSRTASDQPVGIGASITPLSPKHSIDPHDLSLSTFLVDYPPGASAMLHCRPSSGYVLVYVLSGELHASAWRAGVGTYRAGQTWVEPAFAHSIAATNVSDQNAARALVVLVTGSQESTNASGTTSAEPGR